jgi:hypothetical protein
MTTKGAIQRAVKHALRPPPQTIQVESSPSQLYIYNKTALSLCNYFQVPVTQAIPGERGAQSRPDTRWRSSSKILIKGISFRAKLHYSVPVEVMAALYPAKIRGKRKLL